jgi:hypothetical protein
VAYRHSNSDHSADLALWRPALMSNPAQIIVFKRRGRWSLKAAETDQIFADQLAAIKAGIELANERGKNGKPSVVLFRKSKDEFKKIWTYGIDPFPPKLGELSEGGETA